MIARRKKLRKRTKNETYAYRAIRTICNDTKAKKQYPNDPNNFDISFCEKLDEKEVKIIVKNIYREGTGVYCDFSGYVSKYNKSLAKKLDTCVKYDKWRSLTKRELKYLAKYIYKYYENTYKMMEHAPSKALDAIMEKAEDIVEVVY